MEILWVDDQNKERDEDRRNIISKQGNLKIDLIHPSDFCEGFLEKEYDLYLIDIRLNEIPNEKNGSRFPYQGSTVDSIIRERYPDTLIYGLSQDFEKINAEAESFLINSVFDRFFDIKQIKRDGHNILYNDAIDFNRIKKVKKNDISAIFKLLEIPKDCENRFNLALPSSLKNGIRSLPEGTCQAFSRWVLNIFLQTPGFLYDELHSATHLGIKKDAFKRIADQFLKARYTGVFSKTNKPLWWVSSLNEEILSNPAANSIQSLNPWEIAPKIFQIPDPEQTKCIVCGKNYPEHVGINVNALEELAPVHIRCSKPYQGKEVKLFFDEFRGFKLK